MPNKEDLKFGFGPKVPPLENSKEVIKDVISKVSLLLSESGLPLNKHVTLDGEDEINVTISVVAPSRRNPTGVYVKILDPQPRLNILGWIKSRLTGVSVYPDKLTVHIDKFPDLNVEVKS